MGIINVVSVLRLYERHSVWFKQLKQLFFSVIIKLQRDKGSDYFSK